jgi:hypothetical protein
MPSERKKELLNVVEHFRGKPVTQDAIVEYCNRRGYEPITLGELEDFTYAVTMKERFNEVWPKMVAVLGKWKYLGELASEEDQKAQYRAIEAELLQVMEETDLKVDSVRWITRELASVMSILIKNVADGLDDKIMAVQSAWILEKFGKATIGEIPAATWAKECAQLAEKK